jgi:hypothetical protein
VTPCHFAANAAGVRLGWVVTLRCLPSPAGQLAVDLGASVRDLGPCEGCEREVVSPGGRHEKVTSDLTIAGHEGIVSWRGNRPSRIEVSEAVREQVHEFAERVVQRLGVADDSPLPGRLRQGRLSLSRPAMLASSTLRPPGASAKSTAISSSSLVTLPPVTTPTPNLE